MVYDIGERGLTAEELDRQAQLKGYEFQRLPGFPASHRVMGRDRAGKPITAGEVETVFNTCYLIDFVKGPGAFLSHTRAREEDVLKLAIRLFEQVNPEGPQLVLVSREAS